MIEPWLRLAANTWQLGAEASMVVPLRLARIVRGDRVGRSEARRMVAEKIEAHAALLRAWKSSGLGASAPAIAGNIVSHCLAHVRANGKRLSRR